MYPFVALRDRLWLVMWCIGDDVADAPRKTAVASQRLVAFLSGELARNLASLLGVVVDQLRDVGLREPDLGQDILRAHGPDERIRIGVPARDVITDLLDQHFHARKSAPADRLPGDDPEPGLDLVDLRGPLRSEMERHVRVHLQPLLALTCLRFHRLLQEGQEVRAVPRFVIPCRT